MAGVSNLDKSSKMTIWFFMGYVVLLVSFVSVIALVDFNNVTSPVKQSESNTTFTEELMKHERKVEEDKNKEPKELLFNVSDEFAIIAVTAGAILDIVIAILWARKENQKSEEKEISSKQRWRDTKIFWNIVAMGVIQPKNNKYSINWFNMIGVTILLHVLFYILFTKY